MITPEWTNVLVQVVYVGVSTLMFFAIKRQADLTEKQGEMSTKHFNEQIAEAKKAADAAWLNAQAIMKAERAWVFPKVKKYGPEIFGIEFINSGRTPAQILVINFFPRLRPPSDELAPTPNYGIKTMRFEQIRALAPGEPLDLRDFRVSISDLGEEAKSEILDGSKQYIIYGVAKYVDVFKPDITHESRFCYLYSHRINELIPYGPPEYTKYT